MSNNVFNRKSLSAIAIAASLLAAPLAMAQPGSRLCGMTTTVIDPKWGYNDKPKARYEMGFLYECRTGDDSYHRQCDDAIDKAKKIIADDPKLNVHTWVEVKRAPCESVGEKFAAVMNNGGAWKEDVDMCKYMQDKTLYYVQKEYEQGYRTYSNSDTKYTKK